MLCPSSQHFEWKWFNSYTLFIHYWLNLMLCRKKASKLLSTRSDKFLLYRKLEIFFLLAPPWESVLSMSGNMEKIMYNHGFSLKLYLCKLYPCYKTTVVSVHFPESMFHSVLFFIWANRTLSTATKCFLGLWSLKTANEASMDNAFAIPWYCI